MACHTFYVVCLRKSLSLCMKTVLLVVVFFRVWYTPFMKHTLIVIGLLLLFIAAGEYGYNRRAPNPDPNHNHADFAVWNNGIQLNFAQEKYMEKTPTTAEQELLEQTATAEKTGTGAAYLKQYLHLHDMNGHVVHRHKPGLGFGDFLTSLGFTLTPTCLMTDDSVTTCNTDTLKWRLFVNGKEILPFDSNYVFADGDHILLTYTGSDVEVQHELSLMTDDACRYSKTCPGRGVPPTENCIADPTIPCRVQ